MFTHSYKGKYIHGYCDKDECFVDGVRYRSYRAAQLAITRSLQKQIKSQQE